MVIHVSVHGGRGRRLSLQTSIPTLSVRFLASGEVWELRAHSGKRGRNGNTSVEGVRQQTLPGLSVLIYLTTQKVLEGTHGIDVKHTVSSLLER